MVASQRYELRLQISYMFRDEAIIGQESVSFQMGDDKTSVVTVE